MVGYHGLQHLKRVICMPRLIMDTRCLIKNDIRSVLACTAWKESLLDIYTTNGWSFTVLSDNIAKVYFKNNKLPIPSAIPPRFLEFPCNQFKISVKCENIINNAMWEILKTKFDNIYIPPVISVTPWNDCAEVHVVHNRQDGTLLTTSFSIQCLEE